MYVCMYDRSYSRSIKDLTSLQKRLLVIVGPVNVAYIVQPVHVVLCLVVRCHVRHYVSMHVHRIASLLSARRQRLHESSKCRSQGHRFYRATHLHSAVPARCYAERGIATASRLSVSL